MKYILFSLFSMFSLEIHSLEPLKFNNHSKEFLPFSIETPWKEGFLQVSDIHQIYYASYGNPQGTPVVILHGGPGIGCNDEYSRFFDLNHWHVIMFDQRGAIRSKPFACMQENTPQHTVNDIEKLRKHLGIQKWVVFGHSFGSCLALIYGQSYPENCLGFILEGVFLARNQDIAFFKDMGKTSATAYADFLTNLSSEEQNDIPKACYSRLMHPHPEIQINMAQALMRYQLLNTDHPPNDEIIKKVLNDDRFILSFIKAFVHYAVHECFLEPNQALSNLNKVAHLPGVIVHGSLDTVCPLEQATLLHENWKNSELRIVEGAGHSCRETPIANALMQATKHMHAILAK